VLPITHAMPGALVELLRGSPLSDGKVTFAWNAAVGPAMQRVTAVKLERGILYVDAQTAAWVKEIRRASPLILPRLRKLLGEDTITRIEVRT
jgi:predicted nucleic acid-binding Zn ribbon protein